VTAPCALAVAYGAHAGQTRWNGEPYISHPLAVASLVAELGGSWDAVQAALLHDVVEDTEVTVGVLNVLGFHRDVIELVRLLTKRDGESHKAHLNRILDSDSREAMLIKLCDVRHNMRLESVPADRAERFRARGGLGEWYASAERRLLNALHLEGP
jgi:GTP pyrophosphokinase